MPMKMGWRWYGEGNDPITLNDIKQMTLTPNLDRLRMHCL